MGIDIGRRFKMRQHLVALGDDYYVENDKGKKVCEVDGQALSIRNTMVIKDSDGHERYKAQEKKVAVRDTMHIYRGSHTVAKIHKALVNPIRDRFSIAITDGDDMTATGNVIDHEYTIKRGGSVVANVSKKWFSVRDSYGINVETDDDPFLVIAIAVCLDALAHPSN